MSEWQPISSAPHGEAILVTGLNFNDVSKGRHFHVAFKEENGIGMMVDADFFSCEERWIPLDFITHWMPLPAPPAPSAPTGDSNE